jgi:ribosomal protein S12 methylthiotransferase accessory factor YcaO
MNHIFPMGVKKMNNLTTSQIALIRTLWELAQGRVDALYTAAGAEEEKNAVEDWITRVFPNDSDSIIRAKVET